MLLDRGKLGKVRNLRNQRNLVKQKPRKKRPLNPVVEVMMTNRLIKNKNYIFFISFILN